MIKDTLLRYLYESNHFDVGVYSQSTMCHVLNIEANELKNLLEILQGDDYIYDLNFRKSCDTFFCIVRPRAVAFMEQGGYQSQHASNELCKEKLRLEVQLLYAELENLKTTNPTLAERIIATLTNLCTIAGVVVQFK
jgi:hypothetical protein